MTGLPPEAVEAMAKAAYEHDARASRWVRMPEWADLSESLREMHRESVRASFAALPDGVYVVKGGQVGYRTIVEFVTRENDILAVLSATDTKKAGE